MAHVEKFFRDSRSFYGFVLIAMLVKYFPFGFQYFTYQDDIIQYGLLYQFGGDLWRDVIVQNNLLSFRPLAAFLDVYVIAPLWRHLPLVLLAMTALHLATAFLLERIFKITGVSFGKVAVLAFSLYPLLAEATYWISASSRLVTGLFFLVISIYLLLLFIEKGVIEKGAAAKKEKGPLLGFSLFTGLLAQGFYEQVISFGFFFTIFLLFIERKKIKLKFLYAIPLVNLFLIGGYYFSFRNTARLAARAGFSIETVFSGAVRVFQNIFGVFYSEQIYTIVYTLKKGIFALLTERPFLFILILLVSVGLTLFFYADDSAAPPAGRTFFAIVIIFFAPLLPFFMIMDNFLYLRNIYISVIAIGLLLQFLWCAFRRFRPARIIFTVLGALIIFTSICANVAEVEGFSLTEKYNTAISREIVRAVEESDRLHDSVYVFNVKFEYEPMPAPHFSSATIADWSLTGQTEYFSGKEPKDPEHFYVSPVLPGASYHLPLDPDSVLMLGLDAAYRVRAVGIENDTVCFKDNGEPLGKIIKDTAGGSWQFLLSGE